MKLVKKNKIYKHLQMPLSEEELKDSEAVLCDASDTIDFIFSNIEEAFEYFLKNDISRYLDTVNSDFVRKYLKIVFDSSYLMTTEWIRRYISHESKNPYSIFSKNAELFIQKNLEMYLKYSPDFIYTLSNLSKFISSENWEGIYNNKDVLHIGKDKFYPYDTKILIGGAPEKYFINQDILIKKINLPFQRTAIVKKYFDKIDTKKNKLRISFERIDYSDDFFIFLKENNISIRTIENFLLLDENLVKKYYKEYFGIENKELKSKKTKSVLLSSDLDSDSFKFKTQLTILDSALTNMREVIRTLDYSPAVLSLLTVNRFKLIEDILKYVFKNNNITNQYGVEVINLFYDLFEDAVRRIWTKENLQSKELLKIIKTFEFTLDILPAKEKISHLIIGHNKKWNNLLIEFCIKKGIVSKDNFLNIINNSPWYLNVKDTIEFLNNNHIELELSKRAVAWITVSGYKNKKKTINKEWYNRLLNYFSKNDENEVLDYLLVVLVKNTYKQVDREFFSEKLFNRLVKEIFKNDCGRDEANDFLLQLDYDWTNEEVEVIWSFLSKSVRESFIELNKDNVSETIQLLLEMDKLDASTIVYDEPKVDNEDSFIDCFI